MGGRKANLMSQKKRNIFCWSFFLSEDISYFHSRSLGRESLSFCEEGNGLNGLAASRRSGFLCHRGWKKGGRKQTHSPGCCAWRDFSPNWLLRGTLEKILMFGNRRGWMRRLWVCPLSWNQTAELSNAKVDENVPKSDITGGEPTDNDARERTKSSSSLFWSVFGQRVKPND